MSYVRALCPALVALLLSAVPVRAADLEIVASFSILGDMVRQVAGPHGAVTTIVGPDADAHVYQPNVADARAVAGADAIFVNGLGFETWSETLIAESGTGAEVFVATSGITPLRVDGRIDPHAWNSLANGAVYVGNIAAALSKIAPQHADDFAANAAAYTAQLTALDATARRRIAALPADRRTVVTAHDAFGYLEASYGLTFLAPVGIDTESEPSARALAALIAQLQQEGAAALFVENIASPDLIAQIAAETGIAMGGRLYSDALSARGGPATGYLAMFSHNLAALLAALSGQAPASG